jgi:group I intron endonuclease
MIIYKTTNTINGKIYIGQDTKNNSKYLGSGILLKKAIKKYGKEIFIKEILEKCIDKNMLDEREKYWIQHYDSRNPNIGYNIAYGGEGVIGLKHSPETKEKIRNTLKNKPISQNSLDALIRSRGHRKGKAISDEQKSAISKANKGKTAWNKNKTLSTETKLKMRKSKLGKMLSEEHKLKISKKSKGRKHNEDTKQKISETLKKKNLEKRLGQ